MNIKLNKKQTIAIASIAVIGIVLAGLILGTGKSGAPAAPAASSSKVTIRCITMTGKPEAKACTSALERTFDKEGSMPRRLARLSPQSASAPGTHCVTLCVRRLCPLIKRGHQDQAAACSAFRRAEALIFSLSDFSWPQAARISRPRGVRMGEA